METIFFGEPRLVDISSNEISPGDYFPVYVCPRVSIFYKGLLDTSVDDDNVAILDLNK